jgi:allantoin racemase
MRILVMNCNTTQPMTEMIATSARRVARQGTEVLGVQPAWGPASAEGFYDSFITAAAVLDRLTTYPDPFDAVVMAGYGEHGREGARQLLDVPVVDITEAASQVACLVSHRFGVVTTTGGSVASILDSLAVSGMSGRCTGVLAADVPVLETADGRPEDLSTIVEQSRALIAAGADAIVLGCAGFTGLDEELQGVLAVPVIDGVTAAVALCEVLVGLGKTTSSAGPFRSPDPSGAFVGWPISGAATVGRSA